MRGSVHQSVLVVVFVSLCLNMELYKTELYETDEQTYGQRDQWTHTGTLSWSGDLGTMHLKTTIM